MSEYHVVNCDFNEEDCLLKALEDLGYKPQVHKTPIQLHGYQGDLREQKAHIVIPRSQVGSASNDVGYEKKENGKYICHVSAYDKSRWNKKEGKIKQSYAKHRILKYARNRGCSIRNQRTTKEGIVKISIGVL